MWKEKIEEKFKVLYWHFRGDIREKHELCHVEILTRIFGMKTGTI